MTLHYSPERRGFYPDSDRAAYEAGAGWPEDAVAVSEGDEAAIRAAIGRNAAVTLNDDGTWLFTEYVPTAAELQAAAESRKALAIATANTQISVLTDAVDPDVVDAVNSDDAALLLVWKKYRQAIRAVVTTANTIAWPEQPANAAGT